MQSMELADELAKGIAQKSKVQTQQYNLGKMVENETLGLPAKIFYETKWKIMDIIKEAQRQNLEDKERQNMLIFDRAASSPIELDPLATSPINKENIYSGNKLFAAKKIYFSTPIQSPSPNYSQNFSISSTDGQGAKTDLNQIKVLNVKILKKLPLAKEIQLTPENPAAKQQTTFPFKKKLTH